MRVSINATDGLIVVDGTTGQTDCAELLAQDISAVQWHDDQGELEFVNHSRPNQMITDFAPYQSYVDNATQFPPEPEPQPKTELPPPVPFEPPPILTPEQQMLFDQENRVLALEGKPPIKQADFMTTLKEESEKYNEIMNAAMQAALDAAQNR